MFRKCLSTCGIRKGQEILHARSFNIFNNKNGNVWRCIIHDVNEKPSTSTFSMSSRTFVTSSSDKQNKSDKGGTIRKVIFSENCPAPVGAYSQAILYDKTVYLSGVLGLAPNKTELEGSAADQAKQALMNMGHILKAAGATYESVIKSSIFLANMDDFKAVNDVYKEFFTINPPARSTYQVAKLPLNAKVEIEVIAGVGEIQHES